MDTERKQVLQEIPAADIECLLRAGDGDVALLYLYLRRSASVLELSAASRAIGRTEAQIAEIAGRLRALGIFPGSAVSLPQPDELPEYRMDEITRRGGEDAAFKSLIGEAQQILGHMLSASEMKTLFGIYDHLGLPPEVILLLIHHCAERYEQRYGEGRRPTMRVIEREAFAWVNREIITLEIAEEYISRQNIREQGTQQIRQVLGLYGRALSQTEKRYINEWLDMGYTPDVIEIAYDRTVSNTGALKWKYMDSIIRSWNGKGLLSADDILKNDSRAVGGGTSSGKEYEAEGEQARMERMLEQLRKNP